MEGIIVYKGKYRATRQYAAWLSRELDLKAMLPEQVTGEMIRNCDYLLIGTSVYYGKFRIKKWLRENIETLSGKRIFFFVVNATAPEEQEKREKFIQDNIPGEIRQRCEVFFLPGRINHAELTFPDRLMLKMTAAFIKDPVKKEAVLTDMDAVKEENLEPVKDAVKNFRFIQPQPVISQIA